MYNDERANAMTVWALLHDVLATLTIGHNVLQLYI